MMDRQIDKPNPMLADLVVTKGSPVDNGAGGCHHSLANQMFI